MTNLFLLHASEDAARAEALRTGLALQGYSVWCEPLSLQVSDILDPQTIENAILGCAVVLLLWSSSAARSAQVARHLPFALHLKKSILLLRVDQTGLPATIHGSPPFVAQSLCTDIVTQLMEQSLLPPPDSTDPLFILAQLAASNLLSERKAAIQQANAMLERNEQRLAVLATLAYLARNDLMIVIRELAQEALDADARRGQTPQSSPLFASLYANPGDLIGVRCQKCGNMTYFNRQSSWKESMPIVSAEKGELESTCFSCGAKASKSIDCESYK